MTQENAEAIAIKKQKEAEAKAKADAEAIVKAAAEKVEREKREAEEKKRAEETEKKKKVDALFVGVKNADGNTDGGEGSDSQGGNSGQKDGSPYATSRFGKGSGPGKGGIGFGLGGREKVSNKTFKQDCNEEGLVVVEIRVNKRGEVVKATPGIQGTTGTNCLFEAAKKTALSFKFTANQDAPDIQVGFVSINFALGQ